LSVGTQTSGIQHNITHNSSFKNIGEIKMNGLRLRSNPTASLAYRNLAQTQFSLNNTLQRLSSGLRINKAADDSAGSAISTRMSNQIRGMKQANENVQNANNLIQMAEGGLSDISDMLRRMRGLAVQASTDTLTDTDRASVNLEFQALKDEISRISLSTEYNEMNVLDGTHQSEEGKGTWKLQIGADNDANSRIELQIMDATAKGLGLVKAQSNSTNGMLSQAPISSTNANSTSGSNLTLGRPAMTNSNEGNNPSRSSEAVDGNPGSRWSSNRNDPGPDINNPHYLIVDLEEVQSIGQIKLNIAGGDNWNQTFSVLVSTDHEDWSIVASETDSTGTFIYDLPSPDVRYIKFESYYSEDAGQVNVYELEAYKDLSGMDLSGANLQDANLQAVGDDLQWLADANLQGGYL
jgi:flagellin